MTLFHFKSPSPQEKAQALAGLLGIAQLFRPGQDGSIGWTWWDKVGYHQAWSGFGKDWPGSVRIG